MFITNYNPTKHDLYIFDPSTQLVLVSEDPPTPDEAVGNRQTLTPISYNPNRLGAVGVEGCVAPDWSGLRTRSRGSNQYAEPHRCYRNGQALYTDPQQKYLDHRYWNQGLPAYVIVSPRHFIGCEHFHAGTDDIQITLIGKDNVKIFREARYIADSGDLRLYRFKTKQECIDSGTDPAVAFDQSLTEEDQTQIKVYKIIDPHSTNAGTQFWTQSPNGSFVLQIAQINSNSSSQGSYVLAESVTTNYNSVNSEFPLTAGSNNNLYGYERWSGDSGSPVLVTTAQDTYLYGLAFLSGLPPIGLSPNWEWLSTLVRADGVEISRYSTSTVSLSMTGVSEQHRLYKSGFLEECAGNGLPFTRRPDNSGSLVPYEEYSPLVGAKLSGNIPGTSNRVLLQDIRIYPYSQDSPHPRLTCSVYIDNVEIFTHRPTGPSPRSDFLGINSTCVVTENTMPSQMREGYPAPVNYTHGFLADDARGLYFSYVIPLVIDDLNLFFPQDFPEMSYNLYPGPYELAPFCVDKVVGEVTEVVVNSDLPVNPIIFKEGSNYEFTTTDSTITADIVAGSGSGLHPCNTPTVTPPVLKTFCGYVADDLGQLRVNVDGCFTCDDALAANGTTSGITIEGHCAPCCLCTDYKNVSDYLKAIYIQYYKLVNKMKVLIQQYNSVNEQFGTEGASCVSFGKFNARYRVWPQQNFKIQVQALIENNTLDKIRVQDITLKAKLKTAYTICNPQDTTSASQYLMMKGDPIKVVPAVDSLYLYVGKFNPTPKAIAASLDGPGTVSTKVDFRELPGSAPDVPGAGGPLDLEPCSGYVVISTGFHIIDPVFRRIVNIHGVSTSNSGGTSGSGALCDASGVDLSNHTDAVEVELELELEYTGTKENESYCHSLDTWPLAGGTKRFKVFANKTSLTPCMPARAVSVTLAPLSQYGDNYRHLNLNFSEPVKGRLLVNVRFKQPTINPDGDIVWVDPGPNYTVTRDITANGDQTLDLGVPYAPTGHAQLVGPVQCIVTSAYSTTVPIHSLYTVCQSDTYPDNNINITVPSFELTSSFTFISTAP